MPTAHIEGGLLPHLDGVRVVAGVSQLQCRSCHTWIGDGWQAVPSMQQCLLLSSAGSMLHANTDAAWLFLRYRVLVGRCFGVSTCVFALYGWIVSHGFCVCTRKVWQGSDGPACALQRFRYAVGAHGPSAGLVTNEGPYHTARCARAVVHVRTMDTANHVVCIVCGSTARGPHPQAICVGGDHWAVSWWTHGGLSALLLGPV